MLARPGRPSASRPGRREPARTRRRATEPVPAEVALAFHPRTLAQLLFVRSSLRLDDRTDRFLAAAITGILHGKSAVVPVDADAEHVQHGAALRPRLRRPDRLRSRRERDVFDGLDAKLDRLYRQPLPADRGIALLGDARDAGAARAGGAPRARPARIAPGWSSPRRPTCGSSSTATTTGCGRGSWASTPGAIDATLDDAHHREPYLAFLRDVLADLRPALTDDAVVVLVIGDVETDRGGRSTAAIGLAERVWEQAARPRATGSPASRSTTSPPTAR